MIETLKQYEEKGLVKSQKHPEEDLLIWNYMPEVQYNPELWDDVTMMCRGLITNSNGDIIERPFRKFFNQGEMPNEPTGQPILIQEKMDGSLGILYWIKDKPFIASRGSFISEQAIKGTEMLNVRIEMCNVLDDLKRLKEYTNLFEIIYPENRIVVNYGNNCDLFYLGSNKKLEDRFIIHQDLDFPKARTYNFKQFTEAMKVQPKGQKAEGFVVTFSCGGRLKYKFEDYKRLHFVMTQLTDRTIWEWLKNGENIAKNLEAIPDEYYQEIAEFADKLLKKHRNIKIFAQYMYNNCIKLETRKDQAFWIFDRIKTEGHDKKLSSIVFQMLDGRDPTETIWQMLYPEAGSSFKGVRDGSNDT